MMIDVCRYLVSRPCNRLNDMNMCLLPFHKQVSEKIIILIITGGKDVKEYTIFISSFDKCNNPCSRSLMSYMFERHTYIKS